MAEQPLIPLSAITWVGSGLKRPECVLTTAKGEVFAGDHEAGIVEIGKPKRTLVGAPPGFVPNGVAMRPDRRFLIANLGPGGGVWRLDHEWRLWPELFEVEGEALRVCNFVGLDSGHTEWISVSTRQYPREQAMKPNFGDGFIVRRDKLGARIVAGGLAYTNECHVDPSGEWLWVNETMGRRITRFAVTKHGLGRREVMHEFGPGEFPDGFAFDAEGAAWVACVVSNRVIRIEANGRRTLILDDSDPDVIDQAEAQYQRRLGGREGLEGGATRSLRNIASVAFGGPDLKTVYLGCLNGTGVISFKSPIAGAKPAQWDW